MVEEENDHGTTLYSLTIQTNVQLEVSWQEGNKFGRPPPLLTLVQVALQLVEPDARPIKSIGLAAGVLSIREDTGHGGWTPRTIKHLQGPSSLRRQYCRNPKSLNNQRQKMPIYPYISQQTTPQHMKTEPLR